MQCKDVTEILQNWKKHGLCCLNEISKKSVGKIPVSPIGKLVWSFAAKFSEDPICAEHVLSRCCRNEAVLSLQLSLLIPANNCHAKYWDKDREIVFAFLSVLPSLISRQTQKKQNVYWKQQAARWGGEGKQRTQREMWYPTGEGSRGPSVQLWKWLDQRRRQQEGSDRDRRLGVTEKRKSL